MNCTQKQQLVCFPKVRVYKPWFRHFNDHKDFRNEGTVHLFSLMALFSYANFRSNERVIYGDRYMEAPGQWICKLGALPRILRVHSKAQALELMEYFQDHGFLTFEILDEEKEILRFTISDWKEHCTHLQYNYYSYKGSGFFFFPLPVGRLLLKTARKEVGIVFSELDAIMDMWLHTILKDPKVRGSEYMPVVYYSNMRGMPLLSYTYLARRWGWSKSRVGRFMLKAGEYGIISRVSFSSSRGSVISMCRYREMIYGEGCEELELSRILLGVNQHNNSLVIVDIFNSRVYKNANMVLLGTSGAGKTFTLQLIALRMRRKSTQVFIIAPLKGHEFLRACNNIGGEFISISPASKQCINVCEIRKQDLSSNQLIDGVVNENSILAKKIQQLHIFFSLLIPDINHEERQLLDEALIRTYAKKGITHNNESLIDPDHPDRYREMPLLGDVYEILMESPETKRMGNILNRLVNGSAKTFNQHTNVQLDNLYTVLDISELTGELLPVGMFVALDYVWDKAKEDRTKEKAIFIDEAWELIGDDDTSNPNNAKALAGEWVQEIFKIIRGYGGAAVAATQDIGDLDRSRFGKGILNVAKTKIILNLEDDEARRVQSILHLSDAEIMSITRFERGQGLISTNSNHITVSFKASPLEKQLITTDRMELNQILQEKMAQNAHNADL